MKRNYNPNWVQIIFYFLSFCFVNSKTAITWCKGKNKNELRLVKCFKVSRKHTVEIQIICHILNATDN